MLITVTNGLQARLLEHNVRFGDPECQCLMLRLRSDLLAVLLAAAEGKLSGHQLDWAPEAALTVCIAPILLPCTWWWHWRSSLHCS